MTSRVQFREEEDVVAYVQSRGINPNALARRLFEEEVRRMRAQERAERLRGARITLPRSAAPAVRADREGR